MASIPGPKRLLITGMYRSGTTLVEKLIHAHPQCAVASQPLGPLYLELKQQWFAQLGVRRRLPLGHLLNEDSYDFADLADWLDAVRLTRATLATVLDEAAASETVWTPEVGRLRERIEPGLLADVLAQLYASLPDLLGKPAAGWQGTKEIVLEEFIPWSLAREYHVVLVLRDLEGILQSLEGSGARQWMGRRRPTLFHVRCWRKSVAFAAAFADHPRLRILSYERLLAEPHQELAGIWEFLGLAPIPLPDLRRGLRDQAGNVWSGNSSFGPGERRLELPQMVSDLLAVTCHHERRWLQRRWGDSEAAAREPPGSAQAARILGEFREPRPVDHPGFPADYSGTPEHVAEELQRLALLGQDALPSRADQRRWFIHERAYLALRGCR